MLHPPTVEEFKAAYKALEEWSVVPSQGIWYSRPFHYEEGKPATRKCCPWTALCVAGAPDCGDVFDDLNDALDEGQYVIDRLALPEDLATAFVLGVDGKQITEPTLAETEFYRRGQEVAEALFPVAKPETAE